MIVYQSFYFQAGINKDKVQSALVLDAGLPESRIAMQLLSKVIRVPTVVFTLDQFDFQKQLKEEFPQAQMIFTPTEKLLTSATEISCGLGFDLILDYGGELQ